MTKLEGVHPSLVTLVNNAKKAGAEFIVVEGVRTQQRQNLLIREGKTRTRNSKHIKQRDGYSHAVDVAPKKDGAVSWDWKDFYQLISVFVKEAAKMNEEFTWGGVWDKRMRKLDATNLRKECNDYSMRRKSSGRKPFLDGPHIQLEK